MPDLNETLIETVATQHLRRYASEYYADHLTWRNFAVEAREDVAAVLRVLDEEIDRAVENGNDEWPGPDDLGLIANAIDPATEEPRNV